MCRGKIVDGRVQKIFKERALLEQAFIKDTSKTVADHIKAQVATIGENIQVGALRSQAQSVQYPPVSACYASGGLTGSLTDMLAVQVRRFARFVLGEGIEKKQEDFAAEIAAATGQA